MAYKAPQDSPFSRKLEHFEIFHYKNTNVYISEPNSINFEDIPNSLYY
jgi:hypothetical protein